MPSWKDNPIFKLFDIAINGIPFIQGEGQNPNVTKFTLSADEVVKCREIVEGGGDLKTDELVRQITLGFGVGYEEGDKTNIVVDNNWASGVCGILEHKIGLIREK